MSKSYLARLAVAAAIAALPTAGVLAATSSSNLSVTASVAAVCKLTLSGPMAFGALDPTVGTDVTASASASYQCTKGTPVTSFTVNSGTSGTYTGSMTGAASVSNTLPFTITWTNPGPFTGGGFGVSGNSVTLSGKVLGTDYVGAVPDSYAASVPIAVNY